VVHELMSQHTDLRHLTSLPCLLAT
jgi:hypothetical protein